MTTDKPAIDVVFEAMADGQRRAVLAFLLDISEATVEELAAAIEEQANGYHRSDHGSDPVVRLHHVHLPKLADANLVDYDRGSGQVKYVGGSEIADLLATTPDGAHPSEPLIDCH